MGRTLLHRGAIAVAALTLLLACRLSPAADAKEVKLDAAQQEAVNKLRAKGAAVMQIAADTDALSVNLSMAGKQATDADVALVKGLPKVQQLDLHNTAVTDAGLANVAGLTALTQLHLNGTAVTDAGLVHLKGLAALEYLNLYNTAVSDEGVKNLSDLKKLRKLYLWQTKVTDAGAKALKGAIPEITVNRGEELTLPPPATKPAADPKTAEAKPGAPKATPVAAGKPVNDKCPVSGKDLDPERFLVYEGKTVGFCCDKCPKAFEKDPKKFTAKIPAFAVAAPAAAEDKPKTPAADKPAADKPAAKAVDIDADGFIRTWLIVGPIKVESPAEDVDKPVIAKEADLKPKEGDKVDGKDNGLVWKKVTAEDYFVDFNVVLKAEGENGVCAYAVAYVHAAAEMKDLVLLMGSNDQGKVFVNGKEVVKFTEGRTLEKDTDKAEGVTLNKGANVVVFKVLNDANNWQGCVRFTTKDGKPASGLTVKTTAE